MRTSGCGKSCPLIGRLRESALSRGVMVRRKKNVQHQKRSLPRCRCLEGVVMLLRLLQVAVLVNACALICKASVQAGPICGCDARALYMVGSGANTLYIIATYFQVSSGFEIIQYLSNISNPNVILEGQLLRIPFPCDCPQSAHTFLYTVSSGDQVNTIAAHNYGNLTTVEAIKSANAALDTQNLNVGEVLSIPINCFCGNSSVSDEYGLFGTYAAQPNDTLSSLSHRFNVSQQLLRQYNPTVSFDSLVPFASILFIPVTNSSGQYPPLKASAATGGARAGKSNQGIIIGAAAGGGIFLLALGLGVWFLWARYLRQSQNEQARTHDQFAEAFDAASATQMKLNNNAFSEKLSNTRGALPADHCINFSLDELAAATDNFSLSKQIGKGGFATVYYGEWQGQKLAVKRMDMKEEREFSNELTILSSVHHANLVDLIGYCTEGYLFLVYEYVDNGTLAHHLRSGTNPMRWTTRVQIALDAARGIEYMHDHTRPTYIHRDLKPNNILIDSNFHAKVGDFGLTRLLDPDGDGWTKTFSAYGTYGYMAPEYAQFGKISVKLDVFAFGIILFQIVSGKEAILGVSGQLQSLFEEVMGRSDAKEELKRLVDSALGTDYPIESVWKMVELATRCTQKQPELRPQMREVVMQLMMLSSDAHLFTQEN